MTLEEAIVAKLQQIPEGTREKVPLLLDEWIEQHPITISGELGKDAKHY